MTDVRLVVFILLLSSAILLLLSGITWLRRKNAGPPAVYLSICMAGAAIYNFGYAMDLTGNTLQDIMFWVRFQHWGIQAVVPTWLLFSLHLSGRENLITRKRAMLLFAVPLFLLLATQTLGGLNLFHINPRLETFGALTVFTYDRGLFAWISVTYFTFCIAASTFLFILMRLRSAPAFRIQADVFLLGSLIPWTMMVFYMFGEVPYGLDLTPSALTISGLLFSFGLFRYRILDIVPLARDIIFDSMSDGVLVLDTLGRIIDLNSCLQRMIPEARKTSVGFPVAEVLAGYPDLLEQIGKREADTFEIKVGSVEGTRFYKCSISPLADWRKASAGKVIIFSDFTQVHHLLEQLEKLAALDGLTGIYNRRHFSELAAREVYRFQRYGGALSLIMLDLDHFKNINDTYGHAAGDMVLLTAVKTFQRILRKTDILGRFGGEEFIILLPETELATAEAIAEKIRLALEQTSIRFQNRSFTFTASFGVAGVASLENAVLEDLFDRVDRALYKAKKNGRNQVRIA